MRGHYKWCPECQAELDRMSFKERVFELDRLEAKMRANRNGLSRFEREFLEHLRHLNGDNVRQMMDDGLTLEDCQHLRRFKTAVIRHGVNSDEFVFVTILRFVDMWDDSAMEALSNEIRRVCIGNQNGSTHSKNPATQVAGFLFFILLLLAGIP